MNDLTPEQIKAERAAHRARHVALQSRPRLATGVKCPHCGWRVDADGSGHASDTCAGKPAPAAAIVAPDTPRIGPARKEPALTPATSEK